MVWVDAERDDLAAGFRAADPELWPESLPTSMQPRMYTHSLFAGSASLDGCYWGSPKSGGMMYSSAQ
jgi:hypothetical protein